MKRKERDQSDERSKKANLRNGDSESLTPDYNLPNHIKSHVAQATRTVAFSIATAGVGEKISAHGCLFIVGDAAKLKSLGDIGMSHLDFSNHHDKPYNVLHFVQSKRGIQSLCKEDGGIVIDGMTGDVWCGNFMVNDLSHGNSYGGARGKAASSIADQAGGCFVIKLSEDCCGNVDKPLSSEAKIEVYACSNECKEERIPIPEHTTTHKQGEEEEEVLKKTLDSLNNETEETMDRAMKSYTDGTREWAITRFDNWFERKESEKKDSKKSKILVLSAAAGLGKTTIASKIVKTRPDSVIACHFCRHDQNLQRDPKKMLLSLAYQMTTRIEEYKHKLIALIKDKNLKKETLIGDEYNLMDTFNTLLKGPLCSMEREPGQFVIVIDALDECDLGGKNNILDCIQRYFLDLPPWLRFFVTTRPEVPIMAKLKKFEPEFIEPESEDNLNDLHFFFEKLLSKQNITSNVSINKLVKKSEGLFIYARMLVETIKDEGSEVITEKTLDDLPKGIDDYYEQQFSRIFDNERNTSWDDCMEWKVVGFIVVAKEPLHLEFLQQLTGVSTMRAIKKAIKNLSRFFPEYNDKLHTYHKSLVDWLTNDDNNSDFIIDLKEQETILGKKCWELLNGCEIPGSTATAQLDLQKKYDPVVVKYIMQYGVTHLCSGDMKEEARQLVLDVGWLITAAEILENRYNLVLDYERLQENDRVVELVGRAVGLAMNAMRKDHRQLPGQLIGRLGGRCSTNVAMKSTDNNDDILNKLSAYGYSGPWWCPMGTCWAQADQPCVRILKGHANAVTSIALSPDGQRLASVSKDKMIRIWDTNTGDCEKVLEGHTDAVYSIAWSPDGQRLASVSYDDTIRIWDTKTGDCEKVLEGHNHAVNSIAWSPDGQRLASGSGDKTIRIWDTNTGDCEKVLEGHTDAVYSIAWSPDGERLASGSGDKTIRIWDTNTGDCEKVLKGHANAVHSIAWSPDGERLASGSDDNTIRIWDTKTGDCEKVLEGHTYYVTSLAWSPDGERLASGSGDKTIRIWDTNTGDCEKVLEGHANAVHSIAWSPDGERLASGSWDKTIRIWDTNTGDCQKVLEGHTHDVTCIAWSPDGQRLTSGSDDQTIRIWDTNTGDCDKVLQGHTDAVYSIAWSPDGERLASGSWDKTIRIWDTNTGDCEKVLEGHTHDVTCIAWSPDGQRLTSGSDDQTIRIWDTNTGDCDKVLQGHTDAVYLIAWSPDGQRLASGSYDKTIRIWTVAKGVCTEQLDRRTHSFPPADFILNQVGASIVVDNLSSSLNDEDSSLVGIECQRVSRNGDKACALLSDNEIGFFKLIK